MGNLCSKNSTDSVEMRYRESVKDTVTNPVLHSKEPAAAPPASPKTTRPQVKTEVSTPPAASPVARPKSAEALSPVPSVRDSKSPTSPNKKKLSDLLNKEKAKTGARQVGSVPGLEGWLYRESETGGESMKVWATLYENRLDYYKEKPTKGNDTALGFLTVKAESDCEPFEKEASGFFATSGVYCFKLSDGTVEVPFSAPSEDDRVNWVNNILDAIGGARHTRPEGAATPDSDAGRFVSKRISAAREGMQAIMELPRKMGELSKKPIVGRFGLKTPKTRWFKLEGGELRYYGESSMRPSSLKQTLSLTGCSMNDAETKIRTIVINLSDGNQLCMEAASKEIATEWVKVLRETIDILNSKSAAGKTRRINVANEHSDGADAVIKSIAPKSPSTISVIEDALSQHFLMGSLGDRTPVLDALQPLEALPGDVIIWQGTPGVLFYILESGLVEVIKDHKQVGQISEGRAFGELALLNSTNRAATIRALSPCKLWTLDRKTFRNVLANEELQKKSRVVGLLRQVKLFEKLSDVTLSTVADVVQRIAYAPGERIIKQGEAGDAFYVIESGTVSVTQSSLTSSAVELVRLSTGSGFGELALISNEPRKASVGAVDNVVCLRLDVATFNSLLGNIEQIRREDAAMDILKKVDILSSLTDKQLSVIARSTQKQVYSASEIIFSQGDIGENFYMIASGEVAIQVNHVEVAKLQPGSYFGETSLINSEKRNATAISLGGGSSDTFASGSDSADETVCLTISRADFDRLLGPLEAILKEASDKRAEEASSKGLAGLAKSFSKSMKRLSGDVEAIAKANAENPILMSDLIRIRTLGTGTFGVVKLVFHPPTDRGYALKVMEKQTVVELHQEKGVYFERDLMKELDYPLLPKLFATFNDTHNLYMLLELLPGGEFWGILHEDPDVLGYTRLGGIDDNKAPFYAACVIAGLGHMHSMDITYRDMKPENMCVSIMSC